MNSAIGPVFSATATDLSNGDTSEFSADFLSQLIPMLSLLLTGSPNPVTVADVLTYTLTTTNIGAVPATQVVLSDTLPSQVIITPASQAAIIALGGSVTLDSAGNTLVTLPVGNLATSASSSLTIQVQAQLAGSLLDVGNVAFFTPSGTQVVTQQLTTSAVYSFIVTNNNDSGLGSLRQALLNADNNGQAVTITFQLPSNQLVIHPQTPLPLLTAPRPLTAPVSPASLDRRSSRSMATKCSFRAVAGLAPLLATPAIIATAGPNGLSIQSGATMRGLIIDNFSGDGIFIAGGNHDLIAGNVLRTNGDSGIFIQAGSIQGLAVASSDITIGGTAAGQGNLISGNTSVGIQVIEQTLRTLIQGNVIGTDASTKTAVPNGLDGIILTNAINSTVGGTVAGAANIISGNIEANIQIFGPSASGNLIIGNVIGTDSSGTVGFMAAAKRPDEVGVFINNAPHNTVSGNLISANNAGVELYQSGASGNVISANRIGTTGTGARRPRQSNRRLH